MKTLRLLEGRFTRVYVYAYVRNQVSEVKGSISQIRDSEGRKIQSESEDKLGPKETGHEVRRWVNK